jgi:hypothetical protein
LFDISYSLLCRGKRQANGDRVHDLKTPAFTYFGV